MCPRATEWHWAAVRRTVGVPGPFSYIRVGNAADSSRGVSSALMGLQRVTDLPPAPDEYKCLS